MSTYLRIESGHHYGLRYEGSVTKEFAENGRLPVPGEARAFMHAASNPGTALVWPFATRDESIARTLASPITSRVFTPNGGGEKDYTLAHGKGVLTDANDASVIYSGEFYRGWFHGFGVARVFEESGAGGCTLAGSYRGHWAYGYRHGSGELVDPDGGLYVGEWKFDRRYGRGKEIDAAQATYYGVWRGGLKHGVGRLTVPGCSTFELQQWDHGRLLLSHPVTEGALLGNLVAAVDAIADEVAKMQLPTDSAGVTLPPAAPTKDAVPVTPSETPSGPLQLADKRRLKELKEQIHPKIAADLASIVPVPFEVDWDSFSTNASPATAVWMLACYDLNWVFRPIQTALKTLIDSEATRKDFCEIVKKIVLRNKEKLHSAFEVTLEAGALCISATFSAGATSRLFADKLKPAFDKCL